MVREGIVDMAPISNEGRRCFAPLVGSRFLLVDAESAPLELIFYSAGANRSFAVGRAAIICNAFPSRRRKSARGGTMRRVCNSSVRGVAAVAVILMLAGSAFAVPREGREQGHGRAQTIVKMVKKVVRALGDGLVIPWP
jgi:hypothetical protein